MTEVSRKITVDLSRKGGVRPVFAVQNDVGARNLTVRITDDGFPYKIEVGTTASLNYKRPDGVSGALMAAIVDGEVSINLSPVVIGVVGLTVCTVSLFDSNKNKLTSSEFCLDVSEELYSGEAIEVLPEYALLESIFARASEIELAEGERESAENERKSAESMRSTAENMRKEAETAREDAESIREKRFNGRIGDTGKAVLLSGNWSSSFEQKVSIAGLMEDDLVIFYPTTANDREYMGYYGVFILPDSIDGSFTVSARAKPAKDISLKYYIIRGRFPEIEEVE